MSIKYLSIATLLALTLALPTDAYSKGKHKKSDSEITENMPDMMVAQITQPKLETKCNEPHLRRGHFSGIRSGIDVSHYQGRINWEEVAKNENVGYAYMKATESVGLKDDTYAYNIREARRNGIKVGCYHFFSPSTSPEEQLANFKSVFNPSDHDLIPIVDVELIGKRSAAQLCSSLKRFLDLIEKEYGFKPVIYTSGNFYNKYLSYGDFKDYYYMIARYSDERPNLIDDLKFIMWQYTSKGSVNGIRGSVDMSCVMDDFDIGEVMIN
jgi:lysozyme